MRINIPIEIFREGNGTHLFIACTLNNRRVGELIIDTGASKTVFDTALLADEIQEISVNAFLSHFPENSHKILFAEIDDDELPEGISHDGIVSSGVNAPIEMKFGKLDRLRLGNQFEVTDYWVSLTNLNSVKDIYVHFGKFTILGLLGGDILAEYHATINYKRKLLMLDLPENENKAIN